MMCAIQLDFAYQWKRRVRDSVKYEFSPCNFCVRNEWKLISDDSYWHLSVGDGNDIVIL